MLNGKCAFYKDKDCLALTLKGPKCPKKCTFFKTEEQLRESFKKAHDTLCNLPLKQQADIADKYFSGETPWRE